MRKKLWHTCFFAGVPRVLLFKNLFLVVAAATENNNDCKDDNPGAVIVEKMA